MEIYLLFIKRAHAAGEPRAWRIRWMGRASCEHYERKTRRNGCPGYVQQQQQYQAFKINAIGYTLDGTLSPVLFLCLSHILQCRCLRLWGSFFFLFFRAGDTGRIGPRRCGGRQRGRLYYSVMLTRVFLLAFYALAHLRQLFANVIYVHHHQSLA